MKLIDWYCPELNETMTSDGAPAPRIANKEKIMKVGMVSHPGDSSNGVKDTKSVLGTLE